MVGMAGMGVRRLIGMGVRMMRPKLVRVQMQVEWVALCEVVVQHRAKGHEKKCGSHRGHPKFAKATKELMTNSYRHKAACRIIRFGQRNCYVKWA